MELFLFYKDLESTSSCFSNQLSGIIIDWEGKNKFERQAKYDTQINDHTLDDLKVLRAATQIPILVRINGFPEFVEGEVEAAIENGANEILLPMVENSSQVQKALEVINNRCKLGILIETENGINNLDEILKMDISRLYIGLNDLSIDRKSKNIFMPFLDGTLKKLRERIKIPFGYGGLTHAMEGSPISCNLLLTHMISLKTDFTFLRRSFYNSLSQYSAGEIYNSIDQEVQLIHSLSDKDILPRNENLTRQIMNFDVYDIQLHN